MPLVNFNIRTLGDLVVREYEAADGYCRDEVLFASGNASTVLPLGTVLVKAAGGTTYRKAVAGDVATATNSYAVVIGNHFDVAQVVVVQANVQPLVLSYVRGPLQLSDFLIRANNAGFSESQFQTLFAALKAQGIIVLKAV